MKKLDILILTGIMFLTFCKNKNPNAFLVEGNIENANGKVVKLNRLHETGITPVDSTYVNDDGSFLLEGTTDVIAFYALTISSGENISLIVLPGDIIEIEVQGTDMQNNYKIKGSKDSELLKELNETQLKYYERLLTLNQRYNKYVAQPDHSGIEGLRGELDSIYNSMKEEYKQYIFHFIDKNIYSLASFTALHQAISPQDYLLDPFEDYEYFKKVDSALEINYPESDITHFMHESMKQIEEQKAYEDQKNKQLSYGMPAPEISLPSPTGDTISLSSLKGKYVLLDFWASWCTPCRQENPNLISTFRKFAHKNFTIYQVSLDRSKQSWVDAIKNDNLGAWAHVSDLLYWNSVVVSIYNIQGIPSNYLLNKEGKIIAKDLRGAELDKMLNEILY